MRKKKLQEIKSEGLSLGLKGRYRECLLLVFAFVGILLSIKLTMIYFNVNFIHEGGPSFCAINDTINCDDVAKTAYSHFLGIPLSIYGLLFYILVLAVGITLFIKTKLSDIVKNPKSYIFVLSILAVFSSCVLAIISTTLIHKICILCIGTYLINICLLCLSKFGISVKEHLIITKNDIISIMSRRYYTELAIFLSLLLLVGLYFLNESKLMIADSSHTQQLPIISISPTTKYVGNVLGDGNNPKIIINEYTDFQCPYCSMFHTYLLRIVKEVPNVLVVHHDFPLNKECNPILKTAPHKYSCLAAKYALAAKKQDKYWDMMSKLFENQHQLFESQPNQNPENKILQLAKTLNIDINKLQDDEKSSEIRGELAVDVTKGDGIGVNATPTYFIGIKKYQGIVPYEDFKKNVKQSL